MDTLGVVVLHYLDDFLVIGYGKARVISVSQCLCDALRKAGAIISTKSVLELVPEIQWLGKWLVLSGVGAGVFPKGHGGPALLGLWIQAAVLPLTRKHARRFLGRFIWSLRPTVGFAPLLSGWWAHCQSWLNWLQNCPLPWSRASCTDSSFPIGLGNHRYCFPLASMGGGGFCMWLPPLMLINSKSLSGAQPWVARNSPAPWWFGHSKRPSSRPWFVGFGSASGCAGLCGV